MNNVEPQAEHKWLGQLVGEWAWEMDASMGPDQPPMKLSGTESVQSSLGVWVQCHSNQNTADGKPALTVMTIGYDTAKKKFVGTFIGSMMTNLWVYEGELDASGKVLTLAADGPNFADPTKTTKYLDKIEVVSPDHRILTSQALGDDGRWHQFMTSHYRRTG